MTSIQLSSEQLQQWQSASGEIAIIDGHGKVLGYVAKPFSVEILDAALKRSESDGPWHTTDEVLAHLRSLDD